MLIIYRNTVFLFLLILLSCQKEQTRPSSVPFEIVEDRIVIIEAELNEQSILVIGSTKNHFVVAFENSMDGKAIPWKTTAFKLPAIFEDESGNVYNIFGKITAGPDLGKTLKPLKSTLGYWFAIANFYPGIAIYQQNEGFEVEPIESSDENWEIPKDFIFNGAAIDGIPSINAPKYAPGLEENENQMDPLSNEDLVLIANINEEKIILPLSIMDYHEIVNDNIEDQYFSIMYCPLTGTSNVWDRKINGNIHSFGVSGLLFNNNLLAFDRETQSIWTQLNAYCVNGQFQGERIDYTPLIETSFGLAQVLVPEARLLSFETGFDRNYGQYPYGDYKENQNLLLYPNQLSDDRLPNKEKVFLVEIGQEAKAFPLKAFQ